MGENGLHKGCPIWLSAILLQQVLSLTCGDDIQCELLDTLDESELDNCNL